MVAAGVLLCNGVSAVIKDSLVESTQNSPRWLTSPQAVRDYHQS